MSITTEGHEGRRLVPSLTLNDGGGFKKVYLVASERAIRGFCIGKNWQVIDTIRGAESSAIIYSIAETAKANNLKPYEYFEYLLTEMPKHMDETDTLLLEALLPWAKELP